MNAEEAWTKLIRHVVATAPDSIKDRSELFGALHLMIPNGHPLLDTVLEMSCSLNSHIIAAREIGQGRFNFGGETTGRTK